MGLLAGLLGLCGMAAWESHTTSPAYINKKYPEIAAQKARLRADYDRINKKHRDDLRAMGYEVADDLEIVHYCG